MADILTVNADEKDIGKVVAVVRQLTERFQPSEATAAAATPTTTQIISGAGLTGGGDLSANRTLAVGAGTGITVNADDVAIATDGVTNTLLANMATKTYKGRTSGGTGDPEDVAPATVRSDINAEQIGVTAGQADRTNSTLQLSDAGKTVFSNSASANTITIPPDSSVAWPVDTYINILQVNTGQATLTAGVGVTLVAYNSALKLAGNMAMATLLKTSANTWYAGGNLTT